MVVVATDDQNDKVQTESECDGKKEKLLFCEKTKETDDDEGYDVDDEVKKHHAYEQVMLDVSRCAGRLQHIREIYLHVNDVDDDPNFEDLTEKFAELEKQTDPSEVDRQDFKCSDSSTKTERTSSHSLLLNQEGLKQKLAKLIVRLLINKPHLHYYQGFHDVCLTYMTLFGYDEAFSKLNSLLDSHFSTFMRPTMSETQEFLALIPTMIGLRDKKVLEFLEKAEVGTIFALSWLITWFSHVLPNEQDVETIFKFLEDQDPHMILYLCAEIVIFKKEQLLTLEPEMSTVHQFLSQIPRKDKLPIQDLINKAQDTFLKWPPELVKHKLEEMQKSNSQISYFNITSLVANRVIPSLTSFITTNSKTAILVLVLASALALQFDRWRS